MWIKQKNRERIVQNALPQKTLSFSNTPGQVIQFLWLFILAICVIIVYTFNKDDHY